MSQETNPQAETSVKLPYPPVDLTDDEVEGAVGGAAMRNIKIDGVDGESTDDKHKG